MIIDHSSVHHAKYMTSLEDSWTEIARSMEAVVRSPSGPAAAAAEDKSEPSPESYSFSTRWYRALKATSWA